MKRLDGSLRCIHGHRPYPPSQTLPLGTVDASVVATCERLDITTVATTDRRDFTVVRPDHCDHLSILP